LDAGPVRVVLEADARRVNCHEHGPTVVQVPGRSRRRAYVRLDDTVAWLAVHTSKTAVSELMRIAWRTVGAIVTGSATRRHGPTGWRTCAESVSTKSNTRRVTGT
jgi:transposase